MVFQGNLLAMGCCLRHQPSLHCQRCMSLLEVAPHSLWHSLLWTTPSHAAAVCDGGGPRTGGLRQSVMRPVVPGWLLHAGQAGSLAKPRHGMPSRARTGRLLSLVAPISLRSVITSACRCSSTARNLGCRQPWLTPRCCEPWSTWRPALLPLSSTATRLWARWAEF